MEITNKDMIISYVLSTAKYNFTTYEQRILNCLVYVAQRLINGEKLHKGFSVQPALLDDLHVIKAPISMFGKDNTDRNTAEIKKALKALRNKTIEYKYYHSDNHYEWKVIGLIELPKFDTRGWVEFKVHKEIYEAILHLAQGFRQVEFKQLMSFESTFAMRFYELVSNQNKPLHPYKIETLKAMFGVENNYKQTADFIKKVIDKAKKELDAKSPYTFEYKKLTSDRKTEATKRGQKVEYIKIYPIYQPQFRDENLERYKLQKMVSNRSMLDSVVYTQLKNEYMFSDAELKPHLDLLLALQKIVDLPLEVSKLKATALKRDEYGNFIKSNPKGYFINALKKMLKQNSKPIPQTKPKNNRSTDTKSVKELLGNLNFKTE